MKVNITTVLLFLLLPSLSFSQEQFNQYFDGADTIQSSIKIHFNGDSTNIWQIGKPQKKLFNAASTIPNALLTDTINNYPSNDSSSFEYTVTPWTNDGILAIQWMQKLDMDAGNDFGLIEFSVDSGDTWKNVFDNPHIYNFYGFDSANVDTFQNNNLAFTGTDTAWKNIWLCYELTWLSDYDSVMVRHTFVSDSVDNEHEGWMIDNLKAHVTILHTVNETEKKEYMTVGPNPTRGRIDIVTKKIDEYHIIEEMELVNVKGQVVQQWSRKPTKFYVDISDHPNGVYFLNVKTNKKAESFKVILEK